LANKRNRIPSESSAAMPRRELLQGLATGLAGVVVGPRAAALAATAAPATAQESVAATTGKPSEPVPRILDDHGRATLESIAEQLIPGSTPAGVVDLLDRVMAVEPVDDRRHFLSALGAFEREARVRHAKSWLELDGAMQREILRDASTAASSRPEPPAWTKGEPIVLPPRETPPATLRDHFELLRDLVARAYYATEPGMKDLGFSGRMVWTSFPGCSHPDDAHR
jgi:Gluconate 2-dehydrogenase subunit 3